MSFTEDYKIVILIGIILEATFFVLFVGFYCKSWLEKRRQRQQDRIAIETAFSNNPLAEENL